MSDRIFSPGKLLLTSEYVVLDGALALAVPTKKGQSFCFKEIDDSQSLLYWQAYHEEQLWLNVCLNYRTFQILETNLPEAAAFIVKVIGILKELSTAKLHSNNSYHINTNLEFPSDFGWGSSSTLMNNLAEWADVDPFQLNDIALGGSGYDIAVAMEKSAVLFQIQEGKRNVEKIQFSPLFKDDLLLIHLNRKQDSRQAIQHYRSQEKPKHLIAEFTSITKAVLECNNLENFSHLMLVHEQQLSDFLQIPPVKEIYFKNCPSFVKSLGGWGGDFVMASKFEGYQAWFSERGFFTIFTLTDVIY